MINLISYSIPVINNRHYKSDVSKYLSAVLRFDGTMTKTKLLDPDTHLHASLVLQRERFVKLHKVGIVLQGIAAVIMAVACFLMPHPLKALGSAVLLANALYSYHYSKKEFTQISDIIPSQRYRNTAPVLGRAPQIDQTELHTVARKLDFGKSLFDLSNFKTLNQTDLDQLEEHDEDDKIRNTGLTGLIASFSFSFNDEPLETLNGLLKQLVIAATPKPIPSSQVPMVLTLSKKNKSFEVCLLTPPLYCS